MYIFSLLVNKNDNIFLKIRNTQRQSLILLMQLTDYYQLPYLPFAINTLSAAAFQPEGITERKDQLLSAARVCCVRKLPFHNAAIQVSKEFQRFEWGRMHSNNGMTGVGQFECLFLQMLTSLFNPIENLYLEDKTCFLSGTELNGEKETISVFPEWIMDRFSLWDTTFTMMDNVTMIKYRDLRLPCSPRVKSILCDLDGEIQSAFEQGFDALKKIPEERLFQWMGKILYGVLYNDLIVEGNRTKRFGGGKEFELSPVLKKRFSLFHLMLQSLVTPVVFKGAKPWSIVVVKVKYSKDIFNYRDDAISLNFSLGVNGFGIIACLQDNGAVVEHEKSLLEKIGEQTLHPVQFEELRARFLYANYLLKHRAQYNIQTSGETLVVETELPSKPNDQLFAAWNGNTFGQLLAGYWTAWGLTSNNVFSLPGVPVSFLENDYTQEFIDPDSIKLPY